MVEIWYGQLKDGSWVVGLFNRDQSAATRSVMLSQIGIHGSWKARNLWTHEDEGTVSGTISAEIPAHGCKILKLSKL